MTKVIVLPCLLAGLLMADQNAKKANNFEALSAELISGQFVAMLNSNEPKEYIPTIKATLKEFASIKAPIGSVENGMGLGAGALPALLSDTKMSNNMSGNTAKKGCELLVEFENQNHKMAEEDKAPMVAGCIIGYAASFVATNERKEVK